MQNNSIEPLISVRNLYKSYGNRLVLNNLSFSVQQGESLAIMGASGSGKSTILNILGMLETYDKGEIKIAGKELSAINSVAATKLRRYHISYLFQSFALLNNRTVFDNLWIAMAYNKESKSVKHQMIDAVLAELGIEYAKNDRIAVLSGGEQQRVAIARAILKNSPIVIMDEASASIDPDNEYELQKAFRRLMRGKTVIMIAHRLTSITGVDEILLVDHGHIVERGSHAQLMAQNGQYTHLYTIYTKANEWRVVND